LKDGICNLPGSATTIVPPIPRTIALPPRAERTIGRCNEHRSADFVLRQEPDDDEDEEEDNGKEEDDNGDDDSDGYSE
jgi:hypothetical protein